MELNIDPSVMYDDPNIEALECPEHGKQGIWMKVNSGEDYDGYYCVECLLQFTHKMVVVYKAK